MFCCKAKVARSGVEELTSAAIGAAGSTDAGRVYTEQEPGLQNEEFQIGAQKTHWESQRGVCACSDWARELSMAWMECGQIRDRQGKQVKVEWDRDSGKVSITWPGFFSGSFKYLDERAKTAEEALAKAHAYLHYR
jgi:hypothetical protein